MTSPISVQLYSLRAETAQDFEGVLRRLGAVGFVGVEPAGMLGLAPERFRAIVDEVGLTVSSSHSPLPVGDRANQILDENETIGSTLVIAGGGPADMLDADAVKRTAELFNEAASNAAARGITIGYHNHWWEFDHEVDGERPYDLLQRLVDPSIFLEVDTYWVKVGGLDPVDVITAAGPRARLLHIKDGPIEPRTPHTAVGEGNMDVPAIIAAGTSAEWHVVELDECGTDMFEAVEKSFRYLVGAGLSSGR
jgi:sugar phosphate isomerase/epimerase